MEETIQGNCRFCNAQAVEFSTKENGDRFGLCVAHLETYDAETDTIPEPPEPEAE